MKVCWISANVFGYRLLEIAEKISGVEIHRIITLSPHSKTKMYDGIGHAEWLTFDTEISYVKRVEPRHLVGCDIAIVAGWRQIITPECLSAIQFIGFHPTLLPFGRGPAPIINTILRGEKESGVTMLYLDEGLDSGDIISQERFEISETDKAWDVYLKALRGAEKLVTETLPQIVNGTAPRIKQDQSKAFLFEKPREENHSPELCARAFSYPYGAK